MHKIFFCVSGGTLYTVTSCYTPFPPIASRSITPASVFFSCCQQQEAENASLGIGMSLLDKME